MIKLESILREASLSSRGTAVRYSKVNRAELCKEYSVSKQELRQMADMIDKQTRMGYVAVEEREVPVVVDTEDGGDKSIKKAKVKKPVTKRSKRKR